MLLVVLATLLHAAAAPSPGVGRELRGGGSKSGGSVGRELRGGGSSSGGSYRAGGSYGGYGGYSSGGYSTAGSRECDEGCMAGAIIGGCAFLLCIVVFLVWAQTQEKKSVRQYEATAERCLREGHTRVPGPHMVHSHTLHGTFHSVHC